MGSPSIDQIAKLQQLIVDFSRIDRALNLKDTNRRENDSEHSFGLALTCWYLQPKIAPHLDLLKILQYALSHDLVEIHAGDTFAFDTQGMESKREREQAAVKQLGKDFDDFPELATHAHDYMERANEEARFVKAVDKLLPPLMIELNGANEWKRLGITLAMEKENKTSLQVSDYMAPYYKMLIDWLDQKGNIPKK